MLHFLDVCSFMIVFKICNNSHKTNSIYSLVIPCNHTICFGSVEPSLVVALQYLVQKYHKSVVKTFESLKP
jgi:hypothetical protein